MNRHLPPNTTTAPVRTRILALPALPWGELWLIGTIALWMIALR